MIHRQIELATSTGTPDSKGFDLGRSLDKKYLASTGKGLEMINLP